MRHKLNSKERLVLIAIILIIGFIYSLFEPSGGKGTIIDIFINNILQSYDLFLNDKYSVNINQTAINNIKNLFQ